MVVVYSESLENSVGGNSGYKLQKICETVGHKCDGYCSVAVFPKTQRKNHGWSREGNDLSQLRAVGSDPRVEHRQGQPEQ